ncbi:PP2C family protein-serine/threonine phosphatase [Methanoplanus endosymbiosus]|uniref:Protein phosphatase 2C domain-containing protein n=1 Tax=Methanoplanus endosymbiosus TaxID=33865 RepID=A0A9E7TLG8_9EURY|nr:protein phosphatase 2C domain-containing protein [Methanoplanus endosymbiosus]UUX93735.1 protein phosphatase 2C domain-containing protein [Methanoplanus endosymbiosus]
MTSFSFSSLKKETALKDERIIGGGESGKIFFGNFAGITVPGIRGSNEDSIGVLSGEYVDFLVVADGLGGADYGEKASSVAVSAACRSVKKSFLGSEKIKNPEDIIKNAFVAARDAVEEEGALLRSDLNSTLVAALRYDDSIIYANTGDSRAYLLSLGDNGKYSVRHVTEDHSLIREMVEAGIVSEDKADDHPMSSVVTHTMRTDFLVDIAACHLRNNDIIMVMSDGVSGFLSDEKICEFCGLIDQKYTFEEICEMICAESLMYGSNDNISVIIRKGT